MREHRGNTGPVRGDSAEALERKLRYAERRIWALTEELMLKSDQLDLVKDQMTEAQLQRIEEERLKVVLQMAGATATELDEPLSQLLRLAADVSVSPDCTETIRAKVAELQACAGKLNQIIGRIQHSQATLLAPLSTSAPDISVACAYRVLLVEFEERFAASLYEWLEPWSDRVQLERVTNCAQAAARLKAHSYDLILSDYRLPDGTSLDLFTRLAAEISLPPFVLISGNGSDDIVAQAVRRGAYDFLPKSGLSRERVVQSILAALERVRLKQEMMVAHKHLTQMATHDELTGLFNRRYLMDALEAETFRARRYGQPFTLTLFDLDLFKQINDNYGHDAGDTVLVSIAETLHQTVRAPDVAGRFGGEEFLVLLINTDLDKAFHFADRLREQIGAKGFHFLPEKEVNITCSIGLAEYTPGQESVSDLIHRADSAMYEAKATGRNCICKAPFPPATIPPESRHDATG